MSKNEKINITHIQQMHKPPFVENISLSIQEMVAYSQYNVAQYILESKDSIVLMEGLSEDYDSKKFESCLENSPTIPYIMGSFPEGIPNSFSELTPVQKELLVSYGAPVILFFLGNLEAVYKTADIKQSQSVKSVITSFLKSKTDFEETSFFETVETNALKWAKHAALQTHKNEILLIYGATHDFEKRLSKLNDSNFVFKAKIFTLIAPDLQNSIINKGLHHLLDNNSIKLDELIRRHSEGLTLIQPPPVLPVQEDDNLEAKKTVSTGEYKLFKCADQTENLISIPPPSPLFRSTSR